MNIRGIKTTRQVFVDGEELSPVRSQQVMNHSPDGFNWGYGGSGPAQLALAILLHTGMHQETALALYQEFKWDVIAKLPYSDFEIDIDFDEWLGRSAPSV